jgi:AraC family transcriptional regulator
MFGNNPVPTGMLAQTNSTYGATLESFMPCKPVASSGLLGLGWKSIGASVYRLRPGTIEIPPIQDLRLNVQLSIEPVTVARYIAGFKYTGIRHLGSICFIPPNQQVSWAWEQDITIVQIELFRDFLSQLEQKNGWHTKILASLDTFNIHDEMISEIGHFLANVLQAKVRVPKHEYVNSLAQLLVQHLLEFYPNGQQTIELANNSSADKSIFLMRAARFIRDHVEDDLKIVEIAKIANLSPFYFAKMFKSRFGLSPHHYLVEARLTQAQRLLCETLLPLGVIAEKCGFVSQSHFTNAFRKAFGITPRDFRKNYISSKLRCDLPVSDV